MFYFKTIMVCHCKFITYGFFPFRDLIVNKATGNFYKAGEIIKMPKLARTFEIIADEGVDAFYNGSLTKDIVAEIQENGNYLYIMYSYRKKLMFKNKMKNKQK